MRNGSISKILFGTALILGIVLSALSVTGSITNVTMIALTVVMTIAGVVAIALKKEYDSKSNNTCDKDDD